MSDRREVALIGGKALHYRVRRNRRARNYKVSVSRDEGVVVIVPRGGVLGDIPELLSGWHDWLEQKADEYGCWDGPRFRQYATGSEIMIFGEPRRLEVGVLSPGRVRPRINLRGEVLQLELPPAEIWDPRPHLEKWLRNTARQEFLTRVDFWSERTGLYPAKIIVGDRKTRWGSCSARGNLSFCYRLIMAPEEVIDAVVVHELCHLRHLNHSKRFYALVESHFPQHEQAMSWLKDHHQQMQL